MDLERILLAVFVIILHFNNRDMGGGLYGISVDPAREIFIRLTESAAICAVDAFVILSGYFAPQSEKGSIPWVKAVILLLACSLYRVTGYLSYVLLVTHEFSPRVLVGYLIPSNWFVCLFVTLLLLSPYISKIMNKTLAALTFCLFVVIPTFVNMSSDLAGVNLNGLSTVTNVGDAAGFNIGLFVCMYGLGMILRQSHGYWDRFGWWCYFASFILFAALDAAVSHFTERAWDYSNIMVVLEALSLTLMFTRIKSPSEKAGRLITAVAECSLGIFIWHTMPVMIFGLWSHFNIVDSYADASFGKALRTFGAAVGCMYLLSLVWVLACRMVLRLPRERLTCILQRDKVQ